jgi:DNA-binding transcriptional regulator YiaG
MSEIDAHPNFIPWETVLEKLLRDPAFRLEWERFASARTLANRLIAYRDDHDLSQRGLARVLGVSPATVDRWEAVEEPATEETVAQITERLSAAKP